MLGVEPDVIGDHVAPQALAQLPHAAAAADQSLAYEVIGPPHLKKEGKVAGRLL